MTCFFVVVFRLTLGRFIGFNTWSFISFNTVRWLVTISGAPDIAKARKNDTDGETDPEPFAAPESSKTQWVWCFMMFQHYFVYVVVLITLVFSFPTWELIQLDNTLVVSLISHNFPKKGAGHNFQLQLKRTGVQIVYPKGLVLLMEKPWASPALSMATR